MANIVTLTQVRTHLRYINPTQATSDDTALQTFIDAADLVIEYECSDILPKLIDERHNGGDSSIWLRHTPVLEVLNVEEGWGWTNYELDFVEVNSPATGGSLFAYSLDSAESGQITRRSAGNTEIPFQRGTNNIHVQYRVGESPIPATIVLAELELVTHWWQNSQQRGTPMGANLAYDSVEGQLYSRDTESGSQNINIGVPYRILELLKSHRRDPIIS